MEKNTVNIVTKNRLFETEKSLYGLFFEDINRSGDGGLYPEMIRNRTFEDGIIPKDLTVEDGDAKNINGWKFEYQGGEGQKKWKERVEPTDIPAWYAQNAVVNLNTTDLLNKNRQAALEIEFEPQGKIINVGYEGMGIKENSSYHLYFFAKTDRSTELNIALATEDEKVSEKSIKLGGNGYRRYDLSFISAKRSKKAKLVIEAKEACKILIGFISLMPDDTYCGHGLRADLCEKLKGISPAFLRFPGGCIVEGFSKSTAQHFKRMVGPVWERPGFINLWGYRSTEGLGYHEYLQLCEDLEVDALYVCNCGMTCQARNSILMDSDEVDELLDDTLCALEYAMGDADTVWGKLRADMGHPSPFALKYLEIGNENNGRDYEERYEKFRKVISEKYPELIIIANTHVEEAGLKLDIADEHFYDRTEWFAGNVDYYNKYDRKGPGIFVGEFAVVAGAIRTLYAALGEAMFMIGLEKNQDIVKLAAYAPLFENVNYAAWEPNLIAFDSLDNYAIPSYYVWKIFSQNQGKYVLESSQISNPLYAPFLKGGPCILNGDGVKFKNATWKGQSVEVKRKLFGDVKKDESEEGVYITTISDSGDEAENARRFEMEKTVLITMGDDEESRSGAFEIDMLYEDDKEVGLGMFATPYGQARNNEASPWNLFAVQPVRWSINNGICKLIAGIGFRKYDMTKPVEISLEKGVFHRFKMDSDGKNIYCFIDDEMIMQAELNHYDEIQTIALEEDDNIILKVVNISENDRPLEITLDCDVESDYRICTISANATDKNTMEEPEKVVDVWSEKQGAASTFTYDVKASSVNVIVLKKYK